MLKRVFNIKILKFILVGIVNTLIGTAIMFCLYNMAGYDYWISSVANYVIGSIISYFLNKYFTFEDSKKSLSVILKFILNISICYLIAYGIAKPIVIYLLSNSTKVIQENVSMLLGMCLFTILNYIGQRYIVFEGNS